ncbi:MAG: ATP synthase F1 subunit gamma [Oligoflexia bacterium]|nr:ATP synthase F1 subunit gamma [Oligoflexia bacterium]
MASGKDLKRRIASVKSTQQITKAMKMVAAARLRRAQEAIIRARPFSVAIKSTVQNLLLDGDIRAKHALLEKRENPKSALVIVISSDRGLCGSFNSSLLKRTENYYKQNKDVYSEGIKFLCIGKKGNEYLTHRKIPVYKYIADFQKTMTYAKIQVLAEDLMSRFINKEFDEVHVIYSEFKSAISQSVTMQTILPIDASTEEKETKSVATQSEFLFEPEKEQILNALLPRYFKAKLYQSLLESAASEHGARMSAMENATKNAGEMIRKLTLEYNKIRQAGITKELLEIVSGAEALN